MLSPLGILNLDRKDRRVVHLSPWKGIRRIRGWSFIITVRCLGMGYEGQEGGPSSSPLGIPDLDWKVRKVVLRYHRYVSRTRKRKMRGWSFVITYRYPGPGWRDRRVVIRYHC